MISIKATAPEKVEKFRARRDRWKVAERIYVTIFTTKLLLFLTLQCFNIVSRTRYHHQLAQQLLEQAEEQRKSMEFSFWLMEGLGSNCRLLRGGGIFPYAFLIIAVVTQYYSEWFVVRQYVRPYDNDFYIYLTDSKKSQCRTRAKLLDCLDEIIKSNRNYLKSLAHTYDAKLVLDAKSHSEEVVLAEPLLGRQWSHKDRRRRRLTSAMHRQLEHLRHLRQDTASIWPPNRRSNGNWRDKANTMGIYLNIFAVVNYWFSITLAGFIIDQEAVRQHQLLGVPITRLDRIHFAEQLAFPYVIIGWHAQPLAAALTNIVDQLLYLKCLEKKSRDLLQKISQFNQPSRPRSEHSFCLDQEAMELYIKFRWFIQELQSCLRFTGFICSQFVAIGAGVVIPQLAVAKTMDTFEIKLASMATLLNLSSVNLILILCAAFNSRCIGINKLIWSITGSLQGHQSHHNQKLKDYDCDLVLPHTLMLWRRLIEDNFQTVNKHSAKLFNSICISYTFVLQLDFWIISALILVYSTNLFV